MKCKICGESSASAFRKGHASRCKKCLREIERAMALKFKEQCFNYKGGECKRCGYNKPIMAVYDLHHRDPSEKEFEVSRKPKFTDAVRIELDKCDLLCSNCHREVHALLPLRAAERVNKCACGKKITNNSRQCSKCHAVELGKKREKIQWPDKDGLEAMVNEMPTTEISKMLGVSDSAIGKRCKRLGIIKPGRGMWSRKRVAG